MAEIISAMRLVLAPTLALLLASTTFAQNRKSPSIEQVSEDYSFNIKAGRVWTDTGIDLNGGDRVHIYGADLDCAGPYPGEKAHLPLPSAPGGALLVKLEPEANPIAAVPDADFPVNVPSHLYLGVNAWRCRGTLPVRVHVDWHKPAPDQ